MERIGVRRGNSSPAAQLSLTSGGLVASIKKSPLRAWRTIQFEICGFLHLRARISYGSLLAPDAPHSAVVHVFCVSFDYLISPCKQVRRNGDANLLGSLEIDRQIEFGRLHQS